MIMHKNGLNVNTTVALTASLESIKYQPKSCSVSFSFWVDIIYANLLQKSYLLLLFRFISMRPAVISNAVVAALPIKAMRSCFHCARQPLSIQGLGRMPCV